MRTSRPLAAALWMTLAQSLFSIMSVGARLGGQGAPWQEVAASRFFVGACTALVVALVRKTSLRVKHQKEQAWRTVFGTVAALATFFTLAAPELAIGDAVTLFATAPIFVALLSSPFLGEKVGRSVVFALVLAFAGVLAVAHPSFHTASYLVGSGTLAAVSSALAMVWLRRMGSDESSEAIVFQFSAFGTIVAVLASIPVWKTPDARTAGFLFVTGLSGGLAQLCMTRAYSLDVAARVSAIGYSGIVFTRVFALPIFGERPTLMAVAGSLLVIGSGVMLALRSAGARAPVIDG
jgi:drug/metabolite transporter (DMT)-like permease